MDNQQDQVLFYERNYYVFSNFSSFAIEWKGKLWMSSEHAYHSEKFLDEEMKENIRVCRSAHDSLKLAHANKDKYREDWQEIMVPTMKEIVRAKVDQHPYVKKKLLDTGDKEIIEDSWRDDFWGWGPNQDGKNMLGKLWMEIREEIRKEANL